MINEEIVSCCCSVVFNLGWTHDWSPQQIIIFEEWVFCSFELESKEFLALLVWGKSDCLYPHPLAEIVMDAREGSPLNERSAGDAVLLVCARGEVPEVVRPVSVVPIVSSRALRAEFWKHQSEVLELRVGCGITVGRYHVGQKWGQAGVQLKGYQE